MIRYYNIGSFNDKMINFNGKMLKPQDLADKMLTLQSDVVAIRLYDPTGKILITNCVDDLVAN